MPTVPSTPSQAVKDQIREFVDGLVMAQVWTVNGQGFPVGRTMGVTLREGWKTNLMQARDNGRVRQVRNHPQLTLEWNDGGRSGNLNIPRVVFLRGRGELFDGDELVEAYFWRIETMKRRGGTKYQLSEAEVREKLQGIRVEPLEVRAEGFGQGPEVFLWRP